jgi:ABC-type branched-subunit amino acid transport system substrate-binding protein
VAITVAPGKPSFVEKFKKFTDTQHQVWAAHAYDAMVAYLKAYKAAPIKDTPAIAGQLSNLKFEGACLCQPAASSAANHVQCFYCKPASM